ncbi:MAG: hypothetical protein ACE5GX_20745 [Thermoanaerobaculia bacterium]
MTAEAPPPPPPAAQAPQPAKVKKKGFGPLGWIAIGCVGIIVLGGLLTFACTAMLAKKAKDMVEEVSENPAMAAAEMIVRLNPDYELVEKDEEAGTLTIYDKRKDENITLSLDQVMEGKLEVLTEDGGTVNFELGQNEDGGFGATVTNEEGETSKITIGTEGLRVGDAERLPSWLPVYEDAEISAPLSMATGDTVSGTATFSTSDSVEEVATRLTEDLEEANFKVDSAAYEAVGVKSVLLTCTGPDGQEISISINSAAGKTGVAMNFKGKGR